MVVMNMGEKQVELTDMITKDGKLKKKKAKRQMSPEEIKEKLRKLRGMSVSVYVKYLVALVAGIFIPSTKYP